MYIVTGLFELQYALGSFCKYLLPTDLLWSKFIGKQGMMTTRVWDGTSAASAAFQGWGFVTLQRYIHVMICKLGWKDELSICTGHFLQLLCFHLIHPLLSWPQDERRGLLLKERRFTVQSSSYLPDLSSTYLKIETSLVLTKEENQSWKSWTFLWHASTVLSVGRPHLKTLGRH